MIVIRNIRNARIPRVGNKPGIPYIILGCSSINKSHTAIRSFQTSNTSSIFIARKKPVTDDIIVPKVEHSTSDGVKKPRSDIKILRDLKKVKKKTKRDTTDNTSKENLAYLEVQQALAEHNAKHKENRQIVLGQILNPSSLIDKFLFSKNRPEITIPNVDIVYQTYEGDGVGFIPKSMYVTPFTEDESEIYNKYTAVVVPKTIKGDRVDIKLTLHTRFYAEGVLQNVRDSISKNARNDKLVVCEKFNECSGCQLQMMTYDDQLKFKESTIAKAYKFFYPSLLDQFSGSFGTVYGSPMEYAYRNKITPHFKYPREGREDVSINIGLQHINPTKGIVDVDRCEIATQIINDELTVKREEVFSSLSDIPRHKQGKQQTLFLRESVRVDKQTGEFDRVCLSNPRKSVITEKVEDFVFQFEPSSFFQNNNHILPVVLDYLRYHIGDDQAYKYIVDTYCGSGFFGISLSKDISTDGKIFGIELSENSIRYATHNAKLNGLKVPDQIQFIEGDSDSLFKNNEFLKSGIVGEQSIVIMDPSRKGSNVSFMRQLLEFRPKMVIYISCNVFTQARDLAEFFEMQEYSDTKYRVKDLVGFDFFPQTKHVETVAILELIE